MVAARGRELSRRQGVPKPRSFPDTSAKWQVSNGGGDWPRWSADGREIFYLSDNRLVAVPFGSRAQGVELGRPQTLFTADLRRSAFGGSNGYPYDVTADGRRCLPNALAGAPASATFTLVVNWHAALAGPLTSVSGVAGDDPSHPRWATERGPPG